MCGRVAEPEGGGVDVPFSGVRDVEGGWEGGRDESGGEEGERGLG